MINSAMKKLILMAVMFDMTSTYCGAAKEPRFDMRKRGDMIKGLDYLMAHLKNQEDKNICEKLKSVLEEKKTISPLGLVPIISKGTPEFGEYMNLMIEKGIFVGDEKVIATLRSDIENARMARAALRIINIINTAKD